MKNKDIRNKTILFFGLFLFGITLATFALSGNYQFLGTKTTQFVGKLQDQFIAILPSIGKKQEVLTTVTRIGGNCSNLAKRPELSKTTDQSLKRLAELEELCNSGVATNMMVFISMPNSDASAIHMASSLAATLREFAKNKVSPIVIIEPDTAWGLVDFDEFGTGFYNVWIDKFFSELHSEGITETQMGTWVPFPEANLPYWNKTSAKPEQFGANVTIYVNLMRKYFPKAKASILLNAESYPSDDLNWENGNYASLIPYIKSIAPGVVNSFGIQGFPWRSPASTSKVLEIYNPVDFISPDLAIEAATYLKVNSIWINTGTFRTKYAKNPSLLVTVPSITRQKILNDLITQVDYIKEKGYSVSVNIFAENKTSTSEATDWSYWGNTTKDVDQNTDLFLNFITELYAKKIPFWFFDRSDIVSTPTTVDNATK